MDVSTIISKSDDRLFNYLVKETLVGLFGNKDPKKSDDNFIWALLGLIIIVGTEPLKVLLRKNIGKYSFSMTRLVAASLLYFAWAGLIYALIVNGELKEWPEIWRNSTTLWAACIFYILFGVIILLLGIAEKGRSQFVNNRNEVDIAALIYRGDSLFFPPVINSGWTPQKIWITKEPLACVIVGLLLSFLNPFLGLPILGTSISFWVNEYFQVKNVMGCLDEKIIKAQKDIATRQAYRRDDEQTYTVTSNS